MGARLLAVDVLNPLAVLLGVVACAYIDLLYLALRDIALGVGCLHVVVNQLILDVIDVRVVGGADLLSRNDLVVVAYVVVLPGDSVHVRSEIPDRGLVLNPVADLIRIAVCDSGADGGRIIDARSDVGRGHSLVLVLSDEDLDILDAAYIVGIGVDNPPVVSIELGPALGLGGVGAARVVRIALYPPHGRTGAILAEVGIYVRLGEEQGLVEAERGLDVVVNVLVIVAEARVDGADEEVPAELRGVRAALVVIALVALHRVAHHVRIELVALVGNALLLVSLRRPVVRMAVEPDLLCGLCVVERSLEEGEVSLEVVVAVLHGDSVPERSAVEVGRPVEGLAGCSGEGSELSLPDAHRDVPVVPGRVRRRVAGINPGAVLNVLDIVLGDRIGLEVLLYAHSLYSGLYVCVVAGAFPRLLRACASLAVIAVVGDYEIGNAAACVLLEQADGLLRAGLSFPALKPGAVLVNRDSCELGYLAGLRVDVLYPVRDVSEREVVDDVLLLVLHAEGEPGAAINVVLEVCPVRRRYEGVLPRIIEVRIALYRAGEMVVAHD